MSIKTKNYPTAEGRGRKQASDKLKFKRQRS
jgi:hypothetical protein